MVKLFKSIICDTEIKDATKLSQKLELYNFQTEVQANANKIIQSVQENNHDILLASEFLQGMDIYSLIEKIKQTGKMLPVVFMTTATDKFKITRASQLGVKGFLFKPIPDQRLIETVRKIIPIGDDELILKSEFPLKWNFNNFGSTEFITDRATNIHHRILDIDFSGIPNASGFKDFMKDISNQIFKMNNVTSISMNLPEEFYYCSQIVFLLEEIILKLQSTFQFRAKQIRLTGDLFKTAPSDFLKRLETYKE